MKRYLMASLAGLVLLLAPAAHARQDDPRLDGLFAQLGAATSPQEARAIEEVIWRVWIDSGDRAVDALMRLGLKAMADGNLPGALGLFDAVTVQKPDFAEGWNKRATLLYVMGQLDQSALDVERTLKLEPRHFGALSGLGLIHMARQRDQAALAAFERALKIHPHLPGVKSNIETLKKRRSDRAI